MDIFWEILFKRIFKRIFYSKGDFIQKGDFIHTAGESGGMEIIMTDGANTPKEIKIGFLGPPGTFSHEAVLQYLKVTETDSKPVAFLTISEMLDSVENNLLDKALAPIENSIEGAVSETLDMLSTCSNILIEDEISLKIRLNILTAKNGNKDMIDEIISHPQPLGQCRKFLNRNFAGTKTRLVYSTSAAAMEASASGGKIAAIGSIVSAETYGLDIFMRDVQDEIDNTTRFAVISRNSVKPTGNDRTSMVFSTEDKPGSLYRILDIFNLWDINMTRIESRPSKDRLGRYIFHVDIKGHIEDADVRDALTMVQRKTSFYRFLGSYPSRATDL